MPNTIKVKRGNSSALNSSTEKLQAGEILYNLDKNYLTVGSEDGDSLTKKPIATRELVGYVGDTDSKIGANTAEAYSIKYNSDSGIVIKDGQSTLQVPRKSGILATVGDVSDSVADKVIKPSNPATDSVLSILPDGTVGTIPQVRYITVSGKSGTLTDEQIAILNANLKYNFIIRETRLAGGYIQSQIFRPIEVFDEFNEDFDFIYANIQLDTSELIGVAGNEWFYSSWKLSKDKVVEISSSDADSGTLTTQQNNDLLDRRTLLLLHGEYYYFIGDITHAATKIYHSYASYGKSSSGSLQIKIVTIDVNNSPVSWVRTVYDLGNYYTKTESDARYVKQLGELNKVYSTDSAGKDGGIGYSQSPANSAIVQYTSSGTVRTNDPVSYLDSANKEYVDNKTAVLIDNSLLGA